MTDVAPLTPRSRGPGHRDSSPLHGPPRRLPSRSRGNSRGVTPRRTATSPRPGDVHAEESPSDRRGSSPLPPKAPLRPGAPSAESINFELMEDEGSIRFQSEDVTHRTVSPAPAVQPSLGSSEIDFHIEPSMPPQRGKSTATEKSDIQFHIEPSMPPQRGKSTATEKSDIQFYVEPSASPEAQPLTVSAPAAAVPVQPTAPHDELDSTSVSSATPPAASEDVSVAPTPAHAHNDMEETQLPESAVKSAAVPETATPPATSGQTPTAVARDAKIATPTPTPPPSASHHESVAEAAAQPKSPAATPKAAATPAKSASDVFGDISFHESGGAPEAHHNDIDITDEDEDGPAADGAEDKKDADGLTENQRAAEQRRRSSFMPTVWDRPWKDPALKGASNKPPPMAPAPYEQRKAGEQQPWDPKPTHGARRSSAGEDGQAAAAAAVSSTPRPHDPKPWLVNSVLDPNRPRSASRASGAHSPRKAAGATPSNAHAVAAGDSPAATPRRGSTQVSRPISPRAADTMETSSTDSTAATEAGMAYRTVGARASLAAAAHETATGVPGAFTAQSPSEVLSQEVLEWNQLVTQQETLQFLSNQVRERERLVAQVAGSLETLKSVDTRITREVYTARDAMIRRTGADVNGDPLKPVRSGRSRSATPSHRRARTPTREAFVDRLYPFDSVASQAPNYLEMKRQQVRYPSVLSDDEIDQDERAENEEDLEDWRDERDLLRDERAVLKQQNAELQFHMRRGTNIKGLTDVQPVTPRTPLARKMRKQSTAVDFFGYDRLAQLRIQAKDEELALEKAKREHEDVAAKAKDWPNRLRARESATDKEHAQAKDRYVDALAALDETLAKARTLRVNLGGGAARGSRAGAPQDVNGTPVPALTFGAASSHADTPEDENLSPRPTTTRRTGESVSPRGSAVPASVRQQDSKQLLGAKLEQAQALVAAAKTREENVTTPRSGRVRGRSGSRTARRASTTTTPRKGPNEYVVDGTPRTQTVHERLNSHKTLSAVNRDTPVSSPERSDR